VIPLSDENPTIRTPLVTYVLLATIWGVWLLVQGAGFDERALATSVCNLGLVPGELTGRAPLGQAIPIAQGLLCEVDDMAINLLTPITSMFLHGSWSHIIGNSLFFWVFGNNIEDSMGHLRFLVFYLACGIAAAAAHVLLDPLSPIPTVGASGAISGILGAYLILYPRVRVNMLFIFFIIFRVIPIPAWLVLLWWFGLQVLMGLPQLMEVRPEVSGGVAVWAHVGGFVAGILLVKFFENRQFTAERESTMRARRQAQLWGELR
jgi:membrane associated rhomboid family serine protease